MGDLMPIPELVCSSERIKSFYFIQFEYGFILAWYSLQYVKLHGYE